MGPGRLLLVVLSFFGVALLLVLLGQFAAEYIVRSAVASSTNPSADGPGFAIVYWGIKLVISPAVAIICAAIVAWKVARSDVALW